MYHTLPNCITKAAHLKIVAKTHKNAVQVTSVGEIMFKMMMKNAVIDIIATLYHLR